MIMVGECMKNDLIKTVVIAVITFFATSLFYAIFLFDPPNHSGRNSCIRRNEMGECIQYEHSLEEIEKAREAQIEKEREAERMMVYKEIYKIFVLILFIIFTVSIIKNSKQYNIIVPISLIITLFFSYLNLFFIDIFLNVF